jgi:hypothetical protein
VRPGSDVCIQPIAKEGLSMHRSQHCLKFSIASLMFAFVAFAQKADVSNRLGLSVEADQRKQAMSFSISTLLTRNLHDVFGENDPARRRAAIDEIYTENIVFYETNKNIYRGRDEIDRVAGVLRAQHPGFRFHVTAEPEEVGDGGRIRWLEGRPGETPVVAGTDFIIARDGRIAAIYLFFDKLP